MSTSVYHFSKVSLLRLIVLPHFINHSFRIVQSSTDAKIYKFNTMDIIKTKQVKHFEMDQTKMSKIVRYYRIAILLDISN